MLEAGTAAAGRSERHAEIAREPTLRRLAGRSTRHEVIGIGIPLAAWIIVAQHGRIRLSLLGETERQIALDETLQRLRDMRRCLKIVDDAFEAVHRGQVLSSLQIISADLHLLSGQMIARKVELELGV